MTALTRKDAPKESKWKSEAVYASWEDWDKEYKKALKDLPKLAEYNGKITESPAALADWFEFLQGQWERMAILTGFVNTAGNVDSSDEDVRQRMGLAGSFASQFGAAIAFQDPQLLAVGEDLLTWGEKEARLEKFQHYFNNLVRLQTHQRSEEVEELLSRLGESFGGPWAAFGDLTNVDLKFDDAVDSTGENHPIYQSTYTNLRANSDREQRRTAWENYFDGYLSMENTLASLLTTNINQQNFLMKTRNFDSVLEMRLSPNKLPVQVFDNLISVFKENLSIWHRYWDVKAKLLGVDKLHPYDVWAPIVDNPPVIPYTQSVDWICEAMEPMGDEYVKVMRKGLTEDGWVDWAPNIEKRQGAASSRMVGRKDPHIFMSYNDSIFDHSTLSHEIGHSMHSYYFANNQPFVYNDYSAISSTVTETASNQNQAMTREYLRELKKDDKNFMLAMIDEAMGNFHRYFFIMPTLARFEQEVYKRSAEGQPLSTTIFSEICGELYAEGYGDTMSDDNKRTSITWAQFLHLYIPYYPFQYAIGISAAHDITDRINAGEENVAENYRDMLKAGGSMYAMDLFATAGVDMTSRTPIEKAFKELDWNVTKLEELAG